MERIMREETMKNCNRFQEAILLDIHGELPPERRAPLAAHLAGCGPCRAERDRLLAMVGRIREWDRPPAPTRADTRRLVRSLTEQHAPGKRRRGRFPPHPGRLRLVPVLAAASLVLALFWMTGRSPAPEAPAVRGPGITATNPAEPEEKEIIAEYDLLRNLELLKEMDHLQQLVRRVDQAGGSRSHRPGHDQVRRRRPGEAGHA